LYQNEIRKSARIKHLPFPCLHEETTPSKRLIVSCNRTESLDASHREIGEEAVVLPRENDLIWEFAGHLHNVAKRLEEDEETGSKRYIYVKLGPDHFRHAFNYEVMARGAVVLRMFPGFDPRNHTY
jgi:hypothetical protein